MIKNKKPIGGMLMAAVLLMGLLSQTSFKEAAGKVTVTKDMISKNTCRLFIDGKEAELKPGTYANAMLLVEEHYARDAQQTKLGKVSAAADQYYSLYIDA